MITEITKQSIKALPAEGLPHDAVLEELATLKADDLRWQDGRTWSMVYHVDEAHLELVKRAYNQYLSENYLNPFAFQSLQNMEKAVIAMTANMLNGGEQATGTMTSGGTESIFMAVYAYRERARQRSARIKAPEMVIPASIHPAFEKAAHLLGIKVRKAPVDGQLCANPVAIEQLINKNTILLAASAPSYPHGVLDPIEHIGALAQKYRLPLHVDSCIGGFMLPWVERLRPGIPPWDFRVPGVTSISADVHKFGYAAKGASVLLYRSIAYLKHQFYVATEWSGGIYVSPTFLGTRPGGAIAAAYASMKALGENGYMRIAKRVLDGADQLIAGLREIPEIQVLGDPCMNIIAFTTRNNQPDIYVIADQLQTKGWSVDRQQSPNCIHLTVQTLNLAAIGNYLNDLRKAISFAKTHPKAVAQGNAALYGLMARIPFRGMVEKNVRKVFEELYSPESGSKQQTGGQLEEEEALADDFSGPGWMGKANYVLSRIHQILNRWKRKTQKNV